MNFTIRRLTLSAALVGALALLVAAVAGAGAAAPGRTVLAGSKPTWVGPVAQAGTVSAAKTVSAKVWLAPNNPATLAALAKAVADPSSAQYRKYLSHSQYVSQFAPTAAQVAAVKTWLTGAGLTVTSVGPDNHYVAVTGAASAVSAAFGTQLGLFVVNGKQVQAPTSDLSVPSTVVRHRARRERPDPRRPHRQDGGSRCAERLRERDAVLVVLRPADGDDAAEVQGQDAAVRRRAATSRRSSAASTGSRAPA